MTRALARQEPLPPVRAYSVLPRLPAGHTGIWIDDTRHMPHLQPGEYAAVDCRMSARRIAWGELYLVRQKRGPMIWQVSQPQGIWLKGGDGQPAAMPHPLNKPKLLPNGDIDFRFEIHMSDGPIYLDALKGMIIGRVVGVLAPEKPYVRRAGR